MRSGAPLAVCAVCAALLVSTPLGAQPRPAQITAPTPPPCLGARSYQVRASATGARPPDGSQDAPYRSIGAALAAAAATRGCSVAVQVAPGSYPEMLEITRPTEIIGNEQSTVVLGGGIRSTGPHTLRVARLTMRGTPAPAAIDVRHADARTTVDHVTFDGVRDGAVRHLAGRVTIMSVTILGTMTGPSSARRAAAIRLEDAAGTIALTRVTGGDAQALVVRGPAAVVEVNELDVEDVTVPVRFAPTDALAEGLAAVEIGGRGRARLIGLRIRRPEHGGMLVLGAAQVRAEALEVSDARRMSAPQVASMYPYGVMARDATLQLGDFTLSGNAIALGLVGVPFTGARGEISRSVIGVWLSRAPAGWGIDDCFRDVRVVDNQVDVETNDLPIPSAGAAICAASGGRCPGGTPAATCPNLTIL